MRVTAVQMSPGHDKAANLAQAARLIDAACAADRPDLIALPEMWTCLGGDRAATAALVRDGDDRRRLRPIVGNGGPAAGQQLLQLAAQGAGRDAYAAHAVNVDYG